MSKIEAEESAMIKKLE